MDIGHVLRTLGLVRALDVKAQLLQLQLKARGHRLGEMLMRSELLAVVESGLLFLPGSQANGGLRMGSSG